MIRWLIAIIIVAAGAAGGWYLYQSEFAPPAASSGAGAPEMPPVTVKTAASTTQTVTVAITTFGTLAAGHDVTIVTQSAGVITSVGFEPGDSVAEGDLLFQFDDTVARSELRAAELKLSLEQDNYDSIAALAEQRLVTASQLDTAEENFLAAQTAVVTKRSQLNQFRVTAPFAGEVGLAKVQVGDYVSVGSELVELEDRSTLIVEFNISERQLSQLSVGQTFTATVEAVPGQTFTGTVTAILPSAASGSASIQLRGTIDNSDGTLLPGLFAKVELDVSTRPNAVMVPAEAVVRSLGGEYVFLVVDGKAKRSSVETGVNSGDLVEIMSGVSAGDTVVVQGMDKLADGSPVKEAADTGSGS